MGHWVVYFSLAALPLFGLGQSLIPVEDAGRRRYAFWLMIVYVASGLGLLLTTSLLGLRRYLRQRRLQMPSSMTGLWLGSGVALIALFLIAGALLPRPHAEYPLVNITPLGSPDRSASRRAPQSDQSGKGEGRPGADDKGDQARDGSGGKGQPGGKASGRSGRPEGQGEGKSKARGQSKSDRDSGKQGDGKSQDGQPGEERTSDSNSFPPDSPTVMPPGVLSAVSDVLKWIVVAILAVLAVGVVLWLVLKHFASVSDWARRLLEVLAALWRSLFGGATPVEEDIEEAVVVQERPRPFAAFPNPFADGSAAGRSPEDLVRYSFTALEAWAFEHDRPRRIDETPLEYATRLGGEVPALEADVQGLAALYARLAYARRRLPESCRGQVEQFWRVLERVLEAPLST
jgi:hypothetical protein